MVRFLDPNHSQGVQVASAASTQSTDTWCWLHTLEVGHFALQYELIESHLIHSLAPGTLLEMACTALKWFD